MVLIFVWISIKGSQDTLHLKLGGWMDELKQKNMALLSIKRLGLLLGMVQWKCSYLQIFPILVCPFQLFFPILWTCYFNMFIFVRKLWRKKRDFPTANWVTTGSWQKHPQASRQALPTQRRLRGGLPGACGSPATTGAEGEVGAGHFEGAERRKRRCCLDGI